MAYVPGDEIFDWTTLDGQQVNGTTLNKRIQDPLKAALAGLFLAETYLTRNTTQTAIPAGLSGNGTQVLFDTMIRDTLGGWQPTTAANGIVIPRTGFYMLCCAITYDGVAGDGWARVKRNGTRVGPTGMVHQVATNGVNTAETTAYVLCSAGDIITGWGATTGGTVVLGTISGNMNNNSETNLIAVYLGS